jgi:hypothetical protein
MSAITLSLKQILGTSDSPPENIDEKSQLKFDSKKGGLYSDSYKSTGCLSSFAANMGLSFVARFFKPNTRNQFKEANEKLVDQISKEIDPDVAKAFKATFSSRSSWGSPLTAGRVRAFFKDTVLDPMYLAKSTQNQNNEVNYLLDNVSSIILDTKTFPSETQLNLGKDIGTYTSTSRVISLIEKQFGREVAKDFSREIKDKGPLTAGMVRQFFSVDNQEGKGNGDMETYFAKDLKSNFTGNTGIKTPVNWKEILGGDAAEKNPALPKISSEFFRDLGRANYILENSPNQKEALFKTPEDSHDNDKIQSEKLAASKRFINFMNGNEDLAFQMSQIATQGILSMPFINMLKNTTEQNLCPIKLPLNATTGTFSLKGTHMSYTFSKESKDQIVIHFTSESVPNLLRVTNKDHLAGTIPLDKEGSLVKYSYDIKCKLDNEGKLALKDGQPDLEVKNINYDVKITAGNHQGDISVIN